ncbi:phosphotransferase family protein [Neptunicella sp. SCSIO 80796]|uniref:phosphotransferase family protein n=1 Tax=Neptunicella plasticusilytica TaxID=3117012 RepID=UPI003A4D8DCE
MTDLLDKAGQVRSGEELPLDSLVPWLQQHIDGLQGEPQVSQYSGGASNWTYCLTFAGKQLILRRGPAGTKPKGAHDMGREFRLQQALKPVFPYVPTMLAYCDNKDVIGAEFYVMEKLEGIVPRRNFPAGMKLDPDKARQLCTNALDALINLHQVDIVAADLQHLGKGEGYTRRQIDGWCERYQKARSWNVPKGNKVIRWLQHNMPDNERICLTHNDFRLDNLVLDVEQPTRIIGVLDWELATLGDPLMDLGNSLAYWVEAGDDFMAHATRRQPTHLPGMLTRQQIIAYYCEKMQVDVADFAFYEVYGLFRLAAIAQQIYYRYHHKQTRNPAFKHFWLYVHYLMWRCRKVIKTSGKGLR